MITKLYNLSYILELKKTMQNMFPIVTFFWVRMFLAEMTTIIRYKIKVLENVSEECQINDIFMYRKNKVSL